MEVQAGPRWPPDPSTWMQDGLQAPQLGCPKSGQERPRAPQERPKVAAQGVMRHQNRELGSKNRELGNKNRELNSLSAVLVRASCPMNDRAQAKSGSWTQEMSRAAKSCRKAAQERPKSSLERHFYWCFVGFTTISCKSHFWKKWRLKTDFGGPRVPQERPRAAKSAPRAA